MVPPIRIQRRDLPRPVQIGPLDEPVIESLAAARGLGDIAQASVQFGGVLGQHPIGATIAERQNGLTTELSYHIAHALGDQVQRLVPGRWSEVTRALRSDADPRLQYALAPVQVLGQRAHLAANKPVSERVAPVTIHRNNPVAFDLDGQATGVGAIERTVRLPLHGYLPARAQTMI